MPISAIRLDANAVDVTVTYDRLVVVLADGRELAAPLARVVIITLRPGMRSPKCRQMSL